jgi:hypothetical protein
MTDRWTHSMCSNCWNKRNPGQPAKVEVRSPGAIRQVCCFCGEYHWSGIYVREDPAKTLCKGLH